MRIALSGDLSILKERNTPFPLWNRPIKDEHHTLVITILAAHADVHTSQQFLCGIQNSQLIHINSHSTYTLKLTISLKWT
jgi:hypothetical protein